MVEDHSIRRGPTSDPAGPAARMDLACGAVDLTRRARITLAASVSISRCVAMGATAFAQGKGDRLAQPRDVGWPLGVGSGLTLVSRHEPAPQLRFAENGRWRRLSARRDVRSRLRLPPCHRTFPNATRSARHDQTFPGQRKLTPRGKRLGQSAPEVASIPTMPHRLAPGARRALPSRRSLSPRG